MSANSLDRSEAIKREHRALAILRHLLRANGYRSNELVLAGWLSEIGLLCSSADLRQQFARLEHSSLIATDDASGVFVLTLTALGAEVAEGVVEVDGVLKPAPECPY